MTYDELKEYAADLTDGPLELIEHILNKHHRAMIEQLEEEFKGRKSSSDSTGLFNGWTPVLDRLPPEGTRVWTWPQEAAAYYYTEFTLKKQHYPTGWYGDHDAKPWGNCPTHWQPLPNGPTSL